MERPRTNGTTNRLIREYNNGESIVWLAESYGVAPKTIYKSIERHAAEGIEGLEDRSRPPHTSPQRLSTHQRQPNTIEMSPG